jgi:hypothetical protein
MFQHQTAGEYCIMMGTDVRIERDPLAVTMQEDQIKQSILFLLLDNYTLFMLHYLLCFSRSTRCSVSVWWMVDYKKFVTQQ